VTALFQLLVFAVSAAAFAEYVLWRDRKENPPQTKSDGGQQSIYFPEQTDDEQHRGAAMSRL